MDGLQTTRSSSGDYHEGYKDQTSSDHRRRMRACKGILRFLAMALTLVAAIVLAVDKQTKTVPIQLAAGLPTLNIPVTAKWHYLSAFVFFVVANVVASAYALLSLLLLFISRGKKNALLSAVIITDILMVALLFSGGGAAAAIGVMGYQGNSHVQWKKVCNVFDRFCNRVAVSLISSLLGALAFVLLAALAAVETHRRSK